MGDPPGRLRFDEYVELALYHPETGFFATGGQAGRAGADFITSVEVGPLFGAVVARRMDALWEGLGRPDPFTVVEGGAGRGALALAVRAAGPACAGALHWVMVERSAALRARQGEHLPLIGGDGSSGIPSGGHGTGPMFSSSADPPTGPLVGAVVACELLDNLPFRLMERREAGWAEVFVVDGPGGELLEELSPAPREVAAALDRLAPGAAEGARAPWQPAAADWVARAQHLLSAGLVLVFDYGDTTASLAARPPAEWLRTYRAHGRGTAPLHAPGTQDITVEVALDQLPAGAAASSQAEWLSANGIEELVADARRTWSERAGVGDLAALRARSAVREAEALRDPAGLGAFCVLEWSVG